MKLFTKIFLCTVTVVTVALSVMGYIVISDSFDNAVNRETERGLEEYQLLKFLLRTGMLSYSENHNLNDETITEIAIQTAQTAPVGNQVALLDDEGNSIYSTFPANYDFSSVNAVKENALMHTIEKRNGAYYLVAVGKVSQSGQTVSLLTARNITDIIHEREKMERQFITTFLIVLCAAVVLMLVLSLVLSYPIKKLTQSVRRFARGNYSERADIPTDDETGELAKNFNSMALVIQNTISELELNAQQKEDFVSNFAHELKTPLTSVIGYADMIYQKENLPRSEVKKAAGYIMDEGMRLEALSLKLMELIVLNKTDFTFLKMRADEVLADIAQGLKPVMDKKQINFEYKADKAWISIEFDLFKTLLLNLADNASKADSKNILISGVFENNTYKISVIDDGCGIEADKLSRITEAFYMVDKSRSRSQHGAGLGLAIASRIASLHNTELHYESTVGEGTTASITLEAEAEHEGEDE